MNNQAIVLEGLNTSLEHSVIFFIKSIIKNPPISWEGLGEGLLPLLIPHTITLAGEGLNAFLRTATRTAILDSFLRLYASNGTTAYNILML